MKKHFSRLLALVLILATLAAMIAVPASAAGSCPMTCYIYYKDEDGNQVASTKSWTMNAADTTAQATKHYSPSVSGYVLKYSSDSYVTYEMMDKSFPPSHYVRNGSATYTVYYVKMASSTINYLFEDRSGTAAPSKTVSGKQGSSYTVTSPAVTGYTPNRSSVTGTYGGGDQTVYYFEKTYTVLYDANGGSGAPSSQTKWHTTNITLSSTKPTRTGYDFLGWSTSNTATSASYSAGGTYSRNGDTTLYAVWKAKTYTLSYNANGGSGAPASQTKYYNVNLTITSSRPTRSGYTFLGWGLSSTSLSPAFYPGDLYVLNSGRTLYAVWESNAPSTYTVSYNANGGSGAPASQTKTHGVTLTLSSSRPTRSGYSFLGWSTSSSASSASYSAGGSYTANASATLYAVWSCNHPSTTRKYVTNCDWEDRCVNCGHVMSSGTTHSSYNYGNWEYYSTTQHRRTKSCIYGDYSTYEYASHSKTTKYEKYSSSQHKCYSYCSGCSSNVGSESYEAHTLTSTTSGGKTVSTCSKCGYSTETVQSYTVSYNANGGSGAPASQTKTHGVTLTLSSTRPTRSGYSFLGWSTSSSASSASYSAGGSYTANSSVTLYAVWSCNHASTRTENVTECDWKTVCTTCGKTMTTGTTHRSHVYGAWEYYSESQHRRTKNCSYGDYSGYDYASHSVSTAYETYSSSQHKYFSYCSTCYSVICSKTNESHSFTSTTSNGTTISVCSKCGYSKENVQTYLVVYSSNGGTGAPLTQTKTHGVALTLSSVKPTRNGYSFLGWSSSNSATTATYSAGGTYSANASITLYAVWSCSHASVSTNYKTNCDWENVCTNCGKVISSGTTHGPYSYSAWTYYSVNQHRRTKSCNYGDYSSYEYASHSTSIKYEQYSSTQHKYYSYCSVCSSMIGTESYESHSFTSTTSNGKTVSVCSYCGYTKETALTYTVSYNANGGSGAPASQTKTHGVTLTLSSTRPTRAGYNFIGWGTTSSAVSASYSAGGSYTNNASITLYAIWSCPHSSVTQNYISGCNWQRVCNTCGAILSTGTTHGPYTYSAWTYHSSTQHVRNKNCENGDYSEAQYQNHTLSTRYDQYSASQHKYYSYCSECGSTVGNSYTESHSLTAAESGGNIISTCSKCNYSYSVKKTYTVTFNANGGINAPDRQTKTHGQTLTLSTVIPLREGYDFKGWSTSSTATSATYSAGGSYTSNSSVTLYAVWQKTIFTVSYNANGGSGAPASQTKTIGQSITISTAQPTRSNHAFIGWATSSAATSSEYYGGERYSADESVILYAVWIERNYDFSVSDLTLTPSEVYQYEKVGITFKADNWDNNLPYDNIPVEVLLNGSVVYSTTVDFVKYGVQNFTLDLNVGALVGSQSVVVRVNWADHSNETRTGNNSVSATFNVKKLLETSTESIAVIGEYIEGFEVVTSFYAVNEASDDIIPSDGVSFDFVVYSMQGNSMSVVSQQTWSNVVIPAGGRNLVYFKWKVPEGSAGTTYFCKGTINAAKANKETNVANNSTEFAVLAQSIGSSQTPNTRFESSAPSSYNSSITAPNAKAGSATWNMWVYENGVIVLKQYGVSVSAADPNLLPSSACLTAEKVGNTWKIKSGYGVTFSWNPNLTAKYGCSMPSSNAYTEAQYVYAAFPEFSYNTASYKYRTLEQVNGNYQFVANPDADGNARVHFIPVYVEDGDYVVSATATHIWTPAGMISAVRNVKVVIDGTIYDDWYQS